MSSCPSGARVAPLRPLLCPEEPLAFDYMGFGLVSICSSPSGLRHVRPAGHDTTAEVLPPRASSVPRLHLRSRSCGRRTAWAFALLLDHESCVDSSRWCR